MRSSQINTGKDRMHVIKARSVISGLLAIILLLSLFSSGHAAPGSASDTGAEIASVPTVSLRAASGASIEFRAQEGPLDRTASLQARQVPHLVLRRNGALTDPEERTLAVEVSGINVPPPGVTVTLQVETQHGDPDPREGTASGAGGAQSLAYLMSGPERRVPVWREARWIANTSRVTLIGATTVFTHTFQETVISGTKTIAAPTDYFRYDVAVIAASDPISASQASAGDHAFLMENQWIAPLPEVREATDGAAPDELIVYYLDMVPFRKDSGDAATWLARADIPEYVRTELVPQMVEAFRVQSDDWGFSWYPAWTSYRGGEDTERLSVALSDGRTWFHGRAPLRGHSGISLKVAGGHEHYDTLTDGLMSTFHHELFHNLQRNINQDSGGDGVIDGADHAWKLFSEGTAVVASSVGQPHLQFTWFERAYIAQANRFIGYSALFTDLNRSYERLFPYHAAVYWRFLYEQCGRTKEGSLDPAAGMEVIRRVLTILYSGDVVDISASTDLIGAIPDIMDRALSGSACPFDTHAESLAAFSRAIYALRLEDGRCAAPGIPVGCGFYDPHNLYYDPPVSKAIYPKADQGYAGDIPSSFGVDFVDVTLDPGADGGALTLELDAAPGAAAQFAVQVWELKDRGEGAELRPVATPRAGPKLLQETDRGEGLTYVIPAIDIDESNRLGVIITRVDANEHLDSLGEYTILMR
jgi:hypothetical protein